MALRERLADLHRRGLAVFDEFPGPYANGAWEDERKAAARNADALAREYGELAQAAITAVQRSPLLSDVDAVELGRAFKGVRAALRLRRYQFWDPSLMSHEDQVYGTRPAGESEEPVDSWVARDLFKSWADGIERRLELAFSDVEQHATSEVRAASPSPIKLFISHSSEDAALAEAVATLMRSALNLPASAIRCTSVDGYRLPGGADTDEHLKAEVRDSLAFVGIVSSNSIRSTYVLFELGARWGAGRHLLPLLAPGTPAAILGGPLAGLNALRAERRPELYQLVSDIGRVIGRKPEEPPAYEVGIVRVLRLAERR